MIASQPRANAILPFFVAVDTTDKVGYFVMPSGAELDICDDEAAIVVGVIVKGATTAEKASIAIAPGGLAGTVKVKLSGPIVNVGQRLQLNFDGSVNPDAEAGSRQVVGMALELGVAGDLIEAAIHNGEMFTA
jgi:hypothetical protein